MEQTDLLLHAIAALEAHGVAYMLVGSLASGLYGEGRMTYDIDIVIDLRADQVESLCRAFPDDDYYVSLPAARDAVAREGQFNVIHPASGHKIDFMIARRDAWGRMQLSRRRREPIFSDVFAFVAGPEDVILGKLLYYREGQSDKHLRDIAGMLKVEGSAIDRDYVSDWAKRLGVADEWREILERLATK